MPPNQLPPRTSNQTSELVAGFMEAFQFTPQEQFSIGVALICAVAESAIRDFPNEPGNPFVGATITQKDTIGSAISVLQAFQRATAGFISP